MTIVTHRMLPQCRTVEYTVQVWKFVRTEVFFCIIVKVFHEAPEVRLWLEADQFDRRCLSMLVMQWTAPTRRHLGAKMVV